MDIETVSLVCSALTVALLIGVLVKMNKNTKENLDIHFNPGPDHGKRKPMIRPQL